MKCANAKSVSEADNSAAQKYDRITLSIIHYRIRTAFAASAFTLLCFAEVSGLFF